MSVSVRGPRSPAQLPTGSRQGPWAGATDALSRSQLVAPTSTASVASLRPGTSKQGPSLSFVATPLSPSALGQSLSFVAPAPGRAPPQMGPGPSLSYVGPQSPGGRVPTLNSFRTPMSIYRI